MPEVIKVHGLGKRYRLGSDPSSYDTLRDAIRRLVSRRAPESEVWALRDLQFAVDAGEALGIVGHNGAGKTTLLKILAGITEPTTGEARTRGRVGALLDVGTGTHPELTGAENIFLSGAILGMRRQEVRARYDEIVEFAGIERFIDTPVKRYSSGMRLRLAFAVAAHMEAPILVVDEVLAVGDQTFRDKCIGKMADIGRHARTVLFVSHDLGAINRICTRAIWLDGGRIQDDGPPSQVVSRYVAKDVGRVLAVGLDDDPRAAVSLTEVAVRSADGAAVEALQRSNAFRVVLRFAVREPYPGLDVAVSLIDETGTRIVYDARGDWAPDGPLEGRPGRYTATVTIPPMLRAGRYALEVWIGNEYDVAFEREVLTIPVTPRPDDLHEWIDRPRATQPPLTWAIEYEAEPRA
jgi:ABC-type polysaccharide/polyol phosphate transport system ATPase subunit